MRKRKNPFSLVRFHFELNLLFLASRFRRQRVEKEVRRVIEALALCNNVTPTIDSDQPDQPIVYQVRFISLLVAYSLGIIAWWNSLGQVHRIYWFNFNFSWSFYHDLAWSAWWYHSKLSSLAPLTLARHTIFWTPSPSPQRPREWES